MIITGDRNQMAFTENYMIIAVCEWISVWDILQRLLFSSKKKYSFPIFGWIPAWRNGSWFRTYLIGFSQEEINERRRTDGTNQWWVWEPEGRNPTKKWVELKLTKVSHPLPPKYLMIFQSSITPFSEWWALHFQKSSLSPQIILGKLNLCSTHYFMDHGAPKKFG